MKLLFYRHGGRESWGAVVGDAVVDLGHLYPTLTDCIAADAHLSLAGPPHLRHLPHGSA